MLSGETARPLPVTESNQPGRLTVIVVTHNSEPVLPDCVQALLASTHRNFQVILVDSGSTSKLYLETAREQLAQGKITASVVDPGCNVGFARANNLGVTHPSAVGSDFYLFLNPDAFVFSDTLEQGTRAISETSNGARIGALGGWLLGYDLSQHCPSGQIDSLGIARAWYGKWYDIGQGSPVASAGSFATVRCQAICGALMFCRAEALASLKQRTSGPFNESFFMYKEDIELGLMLASAGWKILVSPLVKAYHCRGWSQKRASVPKKWRLMSARNEFSLDREIKSPYILYSLMKLIYVRHLER